jgi:hypothetical protein
MSYTTSTDLGLCWAGPDSPTAGALAPGLPQRVRRAEATEPIPEGPPIAVASALPRYERGEVNLTRRKDYSAPAASASDPPVPPEAEMAE